MENGAEPMSPIGYRVLAKRLRAALAGHASDRLRQGFRELPPPLLPVLSEALDARHFDEHGMFPGAMAEAALVHAHALLTRLRQPGTLA